MDRRDFLRMSLAASAFAIPGQLRALCSGAACAVPGAVNDYKALVMVFMHGGNDGFNTVAPIDAAGHAAYAQARATLALPQSAFLPLLPLSGGEPVNGGSYGLQAATDATDSIGTSGLQALFNAGRAAVVANVGTLVQPVTRDDYRARRALLPPQLFSHNDQQTYWQTARSDDARNLGWGGRMADLLGDANLGATVPMSISINANAILARAAASEQYVLNQAGPVAFLPGDPALHQALQSLAAEGAQTHAMERSYARAYLRAGRTAQAIGDALAVTPAPTTPFPETALGAQLKMAAHAIAARGALGHKRQIFCVSLGGFDTHDNQLEDHPVLLRTVAQAVAAFYQATVELGVSESVTTFTASDFGRTLSSNGDGSDHGWGSHHFVVGGAVRGGRFYGAMPNLAPDGPDDSGNGRIIPTIAVDQYAATMAQWFGVGSADIDQMLPNLRNFSGRNIGFLG